MLYQASLHLKLSVSLASSTMLASLSSLIASAPTIFSNPASPNSSTFFSIPPPPLRVLVGNDSVLDCNQLCLNTPLSLQGHPFKVTFHLLPISGTDAVLGIEWLKQFRPVMTDYTSFIMKLIHLGQTIELHANVANGPEPVSMPQVKRLIRTGSTSALFHLCLLPAPLKNRNTRQDTINNPLGSCPLFIQEEPSTST